MSASPSGSGTPRTSLTSLELRCPPMPQTLVEAMTLIDQPQRLEVSAVTEMVQRDPIVVARLLHVVNSSYYGLRQTISSAERAVVMLGPVAVSGIVVGMQMLQLRGELAGAAAVCFRRLIEHSIATAFLTRHLMEGAPTRDGFRPPTRSGRVGSAFTAGLLHDFGKIILVYNFPEEAAGLYEERALDAHVGAEDARDVEQLLFGFDHTEAGEFVARKMSFPDLLTDVIRLHHTPDGAPGELGRMLRATAAANRAAKTLGYGFTETLTPEACLDHPVWADLLARDFPTMESPAVLYAELASQEAHLGEYVRSLTAASAPAKLHRLPNAGHGPALIRPRGAA